MQEKDGFGGEDVLQNHRAVAVSEKKTSDEFGRKYAHTPRLITN